MKRIVVPCDFSEQAVNAFRFALEVAAQSNGKVHLIHVVELPVLHDAVLIPVVAFEQALLKELREKTDKQFQKLLSKYNESNKQVITAVLFGNTSRMILDYVVEREADGIIMGTKGATGFREVIIGSNAEKIVRHAEVPVIAVKNFVKLSSIKNIVFPNTLATEHQEDLIMKVKAMQNFFKATLHIVFINTPSNFTPDRITFDRLKNFAKRFLFKDFTINVYNEPYEELGVINFTHAMNADMIAMGTHGRKGLAHTMSGSIAEDVVNHVDCPIWTYSIKKD
jgi:nucleotide-binding universal stress UspA family protein